MPSLVTGLREEECFLACGHHREQRNWSHIPASDREMYTEHTILWMNHCSSQNRMCRDTTTRENIKLKLTEAGHTFVVEDSVHPGVEQEMEKPFTAWWILSARRLTPMQCKLTWLSSRSRCFLCRKCWPLCRTDQECAKGSLYCRKPGQERLNTSCTGFLVDAELTAHDFLKKTSSLPKNRSHKTESCVLLWTPTDTACLCQCGGWTVNWGCHPISYHNVCARVCVCISCVALYYCT